MDAAEAPGGVTAETEDEEPAFSALTYAALQQVSRWPRVGLALTTVFLRVTRGPCPHRERVGRVLRERLDARRPALERCIIPVRT